MKIEKFAAACILVLLALTAAAGAETQPPSAVEKQSAARAIPQVLRMLLETFSGRNELDFAAETRRRLSFGEDEVIAIDDVTRLYAEEEKRKHESLANKLADAYDANGDSVISEDEAKKTLAKLKDQFYQLDAEGGAEYYRSTFTLLMSYDKNGDKVISSQEMLDIPLPPELPEASAGPRSAFYLAAVLALDPDRDGRLTAAEVDSLAHDAFRAADMDRDGTLSPAEKSFLQHLAAGELPLGSPCRMPAPDPDARIVYIGTQSGHGLSEYTVAGPYVDTGVARVEIAPVAGKIHVIVSGMKPLIWAFGGETSLISGVSVFGDVLPGKNKVLAGTTGIDSGKVHFAGTFHCLKGNHSSPQDDDDGALEASLVKIFGRAPEIAAGDQELRRARVTRLSVSFTPWPDCSAMKVFDPPIPAGFDPDVWFQAAISSDDRTFQPFGEEKIVSPMPVEMYAVLPGWVGIAQLVHDGTIVREKTRKWQVSMCNRVNKVGPMMARPIQSGGIYKIVKNIPYFPAMETSGPHYVLAKGINLPKGNPTSCVTRDVSNKVLRNGEDCRGRDTFRR